MNSGLLWFELFHGIILLSSIDTDSITIYIDEVGNLSEIENITFEDVKKYLEEGSNLIREVSANITIRKGSKGEYIFYKTEKMKKPQFFDLKPFSNDTKSDYKTPPR